MIHTTQECRIGDAVKLLRETLPESVDTVITSPPYHGLRDYQVDGQIGMEPTLEEYHDRLLEVTAELKRVMKPTAVLFWNHGDSYGGSGGAGGDYNKGGLREGQPKVGKSINTTAKCLTMQNERLILRMIDEQGFILRNRIIWHKTNGMPSSVQDRFANKYEPVYMLTKSKKYWFDLDAVRVPAKYAEVWSRKGAGKNTPYSQNNPRSRWGVTKHEMAIKRTSGSYSDPLHTKPVHSSGTKNPGDVWTIPTQPYPESHFATFPTTLIEPMVRAACPAEICPVCGHIRTRIVDHEFVRQQDVSAEKGVRGALDQKPMDESNQWQGFPRGTTSVETTGWTSCSCGGGWVAGTVLDPFCGSGTVLEVCRLLNRNAIGLELNPEYAPMIRERSMSHTPPLTAYFDVEPPEVAPCE
jgi:DNA modification methylase